MILYLGEFSHSGGGYVIAQRFAEDVSGGGMPFDQLVQDLILSPLEMKKSCVTQPLIVQPTDGTKLHIVPAKPSRIRKMLRLPPTWHTFPELSPAGLWTIPSDYTIFVAALLDAAFHQSKIHDTTSKRNPAISKSVAQAMMTPVGANYGLGLGLTFLEANNSGKGKQQQLFSISHYGANPPGYKCAFEGFCSTDDNNNNNSSRSIVVMTNSPSGDLLCQEALGGASLLASSRSSK